MRYHSGGIRSYTNFGADAFTKELTELVNTTWGDYLDGFSSEFTKKAELSKEPVVEFRDHVLQSPRA